jgi:hypothetical protein
MVMPAHRIFYGVLILALSVYSLIGVNLGGFFIGMLLSAVGGVMIVSWMPKPATAGRDASEVNTAADSAGDSAADSAGDSAADSADPAKDTPAEPLPLGRRRS